MLFPYLQLMRPANIITAISNIIAGYIVALFFLNIKFDYSSLGYLILSTVGLYGGGIVFNDFFDAQIDARERPYRPIPSGAAKKGYAGVLGSVLFGIGLLSAFNVSFTGFIIACIICICCFIYNLKTKYYPWLGGFTLALCRGFNVLLGTTFAPDAVSQLYPIILIPFWLTIAITYISKSEVEGGNRLNLGYVGLLYLMTLVTFWFLAGLYKISLENGLVFLTIFALLNLFYLVKAMYNPIAKNIQTVVKWGVLSFILMDAATAASFSNLYLGILLLLLMPLSIALSKFFAVT